MTQNNADASAVPEGEMTANALLEALGTTLEPDLLVEALTHAPSRTRIRAQKTTNVWNSLATPCLSSSPRKPCTRRTPT